MRRRARVDANHSAIVAALRKAGASVQSLAALGKGCPDLLVGIRGRNLLMEVKDGTLRPSQRKLSKDENDWHSLWRGCSVVVQSIEQALELLRES